MTEAQAERLITALDALRFPLILLSATFWFTSIAVWMIAWHVVSS